MGEALVVLLAEAWLCARFCSDMLQLVYRRIPRGMATLRERVRVATATLRGSALRRVHHTAEMDHAQRHVTMA